MTTGWDDGRSFEPMDASYLKLMRKMAIAHAVKNQVDIVLDNTNLNPAVQKEFVVFLGTQNQLEFIDFKADWSECIRRNIARGEPIPNKVIDRMAIQYQDTYDWIRRGYR